MPAAIYFTTTLAALIFASSIKAQVGGDGKFGRMFQESRDRDFVTDTPLSEKEQAEIFLPDHEQMRTERVHGLSVFFGQAIAWQTLGMHLTVQKEVDTAFVYSVGSGAWKLNHNAANLDFQLDIKTRGLFASLRHFPTTSGLFFQTSAGWLFWEGSVNPSGQAASDLAEIIKSGFHANGPSVSLNIGYSFVWRSGWMLEYSLVGFSKAHTTYTDFTRSNQTNRKALREKIESWTNWGLFNLSVGYSFF